MLIRRPKILLSVILISVLSGSLIGLAINYFMLQNAQAQPHQNRQFYLFTGSLPFNETNLGVPSDLFVPDRIVVNKGDTVNIHYYNLEDIPEDHSLTMDPPYEMNYIVHLNQEVNITFTAGTAGIFRYYCTYHQPTMTGYLIVLG